MIVSPYQILQQRHHSVGVLCGSGRSTVALDLNFALRHGLFQTRGGIGAADVAEQHGGSLDDAGRVGVIPHTPLDHPGGGAVDRLEHGIAVAHVGAARRTHAALNLGSLVGDDIAVQVRQYNDLIVAAALGVGMDLRQRYGRMIVDMGAGITDIAVISEGEIVQSSSVYYAGDYIDDAIVRYIRKKYSLLIGERTAEQIKINIGTAMKPETDEANLAMPVVCLNQLSCLPRTQEIHAAEIYEALKDPVAALIGSIQDVLVRTPPQLASDIFDDGIVLSGGAAGLARLPEAIYTALHIPCGVADDPQTSVVLGCGIAVEDPGAYASLLDDGRKGFKRL